jgi:hypothetical protein
VFKYDDYSLRLLIQKPDLDKPTKHLKLNLSPPMDRRTALKNMALLAGSLLYLPACEKNNPPLPLKNLQLTNRDADLLADICEAIIPETNLPGARTLAVYDFVLRMVDDCLKAKEQEDFQKGLLQFEASARHYFQQDFKKLDLPQKSQILASIANADDLVATETLDPAVLKAFLKTTRQLTIQGFMGSEYVMTEVFPYKLVPGSYINCRPKDQIRFTS